LGTSAIACEGLCKRFGETAALDGVNLAVPEGAVYGLLGPNGAGKTTAVRILTTLSRPDSGRALVAGFDVARQASQVRARIGLAGQSTALDEILSGRQNLVMFGRLCHLPISTARRRADELLAQFALAEASDKAVRRYSGGMRRRLDLAASFIVAPRVLFLDEPTTGLDPESRFTLWDAVRDLARSGTTVLLTTQYLEEADALADQIMIISAGRVVDTGTAAQLKARFGTVVFYLGFDGQAGAQTAETVLTAAGYQPARDSAGIKVRSATGSGELTGILRSLEGRAPDPLTVAVREPTLDDVFLSLTGGTGKGAVA
jgi:ABC-2 type transport system ATP-binding protein